MNEPASHLKSLFKIYAIFAAGSLILWLLFPAMRTGLAGLFLGFTISILNSYHLWKKVNRLHDAILHKDGKKKRIQLGFVARLCFALIAAAIAVHLPQFDILFTIIGFMLAPHVILALSLWKAFQNKTD